jgi:hypothetical protein
MDGIWGRGRTWLVAGIAEQSNRNCLFLVFQPSLSFSAKCHGYNQVLVAKDELANILGIVCAATGSGYDIIDGAVLLPGKILSEKMESV